MNTILMDIEKGFKFLEKLFMDIVNAVWNEAKQELLRDATKLLADEAVTIQNFQPGLSEKQMVAALIASAEGSLASDLGHLTWGEITAVIGVVAADFGNAINNGGSGNAGNLPGGVDSSAT